jgi:hypothetical protein
MDLLKELHEEKKLYFIFFLVELKKHPLNKKMQLLPLLYSVFCIVQICDPVHDEREQALGQDHTEGLQDGVRQARLLPLPHQEHRYGVRHGERGGKDRRPHITMVSMGLSFFLAFRVNLPSLKIGMCIFT